MSSFIPLNNDLEEFLSSVQSKCDEQGEGYVENCYDSVRMTKLQQDGYLENVEIDYAGGAFVRLSYKGLSYFDDKEKAVSRGAILSTGELQLLTEIQCSNDSGRPYVRDTEVESEAEALRSLGQKGLVTNQYADNAPLTSVITQKGRSALGRNGVIDFVERGEMQVNTINIYGNVDGSQIQQGTVDSKQTLIGDSELSALSSLLSLRDNERLKDLLGDRFDVVMAEAEKAVDVSKDPSLRRKALDAIREIFEDLGVKFASAGFTTLLQGMIGV